MKKLILVVLMSCFFSYGLWVGRTYANDYGSYSLHVTKICNTWSALDAQTIKCNGVSYKLYGVMAFPTDPTLTLAQQFADAFGTTAAKVSLIGTKAVKNLTELLNTCSFVTLNTAFWPEGKYETPEDPKFTSPAGTALLSCDNNIFINDLIVESGFAFYDWNAPGSFETHCGYGCPLFYDSAEDAQDAHRGIWGFATKWPQF